MNSVFLLLNLLLHQGWRTQFVLLFSHSWRENNWIHTFPRVLVLCEMQSVSSRIWTRVAVSIYYDDNHYTTVTFIFIRIAKIFLRNILRLQIFLPWFFPSVEAVIEAGGLWKRTWRNGYCRKKLIQWSNFKIWTRLIMFHFKLMPFGKGMNPSLPPVKQRGFLLLIGNVFTQPSRHGWDAAKGKFWSGIQLFFIQIFHSPKQVALAMLMRSDWPKTWGEQINSCLSQRNKRSANHKQLRTKFELGSPILFRTPITITLKAYLFDRVTYLGEGKL